MKKEIVDSLNKVGICVIEDYFPSDWCDNAVSHMEDALVTYKDKVQSQIEPRKEVDVIACQFAFHYFLKNTSTLKNIFENIKFKQ